MRPLNPVLPWCLAAVAFAACGSSRQQVQPEPEPAPLYVIEVVGGEVQPTRPDGQPWDRENEVHPGPPSGLRLTTPIGSVAVTVGSSRPVALPVPGAPDPAVTLSFGHRLVEAPPSRDSFSPGWRYRFLVDPLMDADEHLGIQVDDDDGDHQESMGTVTIDMQALLEAGRLEVGPFGSVKRLELTVRRASFDHFPAFQTQPIEVPANGEGWVNTGVEVLSGMHVAIAAEGRVRLSRLTTGLWGPHGVTDPQLVSRWQRHNVDGFEETRHGALIACIVDPVSQLVTQRLSVGDGILTRIDGSGVLLLAVNDADTTNNAGAFQVRVGGGVRTPTVAIAPARR